MDEAKKIIKNLKPFYKTRSGDSAFIHGKWEAFIRINDTTYVGRGATEQFAIDNLETHLKKVFNDASKKNNNT